MEEGADSPRGQTSPNPYQGEVVHCSKQGLERPLSVTNESQEGPNPFEPRLGKPLERPAGDKGRAPCALFRLPWLQRACCGN